MGEQNWLALMNRQTWLKQEQATNQYTEKFGLTLSEKDTELLFAELVSLHIQCPRMPVIP